jgi:hypothetical protein
VWQMFYARPVSSCCHVRLHSSKTKRITICTSELYINHFALQVYCIICNLMSSNVHQGKSTERSPTRSWGRGAPASRPKQALKKNVK